MALPREHNMHLVFLGARLALTKTFFSANGNITASPYPLVSRVTSYHEQYTSLADFQALLIKHAAAGNCLFGGVLDAPLVNESRAGRTVKQDRQWIVFDFDRVDAKDHVEVVAKYLPPECQNVSYIAQVSASMWRPDTKRWSGHIFMLLKEPQSEARVRSWFEALNFSLPALSQQITLSDSLQSLHWPLDRTASYCSKLIYIAPPQCHGFTPAVDKPITLVKKKLPSVSIGAFTPPDTATVRQKINELRRAAGLDEIAYDVRQFNGEDVLVQAGDVQVHGIKASGDHYIRFNLNGGDSYAYYIDLRNPALIRNFKGEPFLKTEDAAPELWKALRGKAAQIVQKPPLDDGDEVLAFYATNKGSKIYVGTYSPTRRRVTLNIAGETSARAWLAEFGLLKTGFLPHMDVVFDPTSDVQYLQGATAINTFSPSKYMGMPAKSKTPSTLGELPPLIARLLRSVLGDPSNEELAHFINWLAYIFRYRKKTGTAWVFSGRTGTGKGSLLKYVLTPLLGPENVRTISYNALTSAFNAWLEGALLVVIEEADINAVENSDNLHMLMKHYISDSPIEINQKGVPTYQAPSYANFILHANQRTAAKTTKDDRRYNYANRQEERLFFTPNELQTLANGDELDAMADLLQRWPIDENAVAMVIDTKAKSDVHEATTSINQLIAEAVLTGDLQFFIDRMPSDTEAMADSRMGQRFNPLGMYRKQVDSYLDAARNKTGVVVSEEELFVLFRTLIPDERFFQDSKVWRRRHFKSLGLEVDKQVRDPSDWKKRARGLAVTWKVPNELPDELEASDKNVVRMAPKRGKMRN